VVVLAEGLHDWKLRVWMAGGAGEGLNRRAAWNREVL